MNIIATTVPNFVLPDAERISARLLRKYYKLSPQWTNKQAGHMHTLSPNAPLQSQHDYLRTGRIANTHRRHRGSWKSCALETASAGEHKASEILSKRCRYSSHNTLLQDTTNHHSTESPSADEQHLSVDSPAASSKGLFE